VEDGGTLVTDPRRRDQLVQAVERFGEGPWHARVPHLPLSDDDAFGLLYDADPQERARALVNEAAGAGPGALLLPSFTRLVEGWRSLAIPQAPSPGELPAAADEVE